MGLELADRVGRMYWTCVMALPPGDARDDEERNWGWSRERGRGPLVWLCVGTETGAGGGQLVVGGRMGGGTDELDGGLAVSREHQAGH